MDALLEQLVWRRAGDRCEYCHFPAEIALLPFQIDHIVPRKLHGETVAGNLALSCERCNSHKGPLVSGMLEGRIVRLFHLRKDKWDQHFEWNGPYLVGRTPIGRVTIDVLAINLAYRAALRKSLFEEGWKD